jgi:hypothetical protein
MRAAFLAAGLLAAAAPPQRLVLAPVVPAAGGRFRVDTARLREAVRTLAHELLEIEATGDLPRAESLLARYGRSTPEIEAVNARLKDIPVDITPAYVAAGER